MRIVCISDTHAQQSNLKIPAGDILLHCGDFTDFYNSSSQLKVVPIFLYN
jgi:hypothetical protein